MRIFLFLLVFPLFSIAQDTSEYSHPQKLFLKAKVTSDSGTVKGYFMNAGDSAIMVSPGKKYSPNTVIHIPVNRIRELQIRNSTGINALTIAGVTIFGFIVTAGLTKNGGDIDNDGKTSFFELLFTAIEGTTSSNRRRRNTALIVGAAGGTAFMVAGFLVTKKLSISFPLSNRDKFYKEKKVEIDKYTIF